MQNLSPIIVALDVPDQKEALRHVDSLSEHVDIFKVGLQLFSKEGPRVVDKIISAGKRVFVDLKLHDIPNTVAGALESLVRPGVEFITIHGLGGREMLAAASGKLAYLREQAPQISTRLLCITVLTSLDDEDVREVGIDHTAAGEVLNLTRLAIGTGIKAVVASPQELGILRQQFGKELLIVTPGVRMDSDDTGDQKRIATPAKALGDGADYVVMGRSLLSRPKPEAAVRQILDSLPKAI